MTKALSVAESTTKIWKLLLLIPAAFKIGCANSFKLFSMSESRKREILFAEFAPSNKRNVAKTTFRRV